MLQSGENLGMPYSRPMPDIGLGCHELRVNDRGQTWRIVHRVDYDAIVIVHVFSKKTSRTPRSVLGICRQRLKAYDAI